MSLPINLVPTFNVPVVVVTTAWTGASPNEVELQITRPVEDAVAGLQNITSTSGQGISSVVITFTDKVNPDLIDSQVQRQLASVQGQLPTDPNQAITPITSKLDPNALPIMQVALISDTLSNTALYSIANDTLSPQLQQVRGVSQVAVVGGQPQEAQVLVDPNKLAGYAISLAALQNALAAENTAVPAGTLTQDPNTYNLRVSNLAVQSQDLGRITIGGTPDAPVRVSDRPPSSWLDGTRLRLPASTDTTAYSSVSAPRPAPTLPTCRTGSTVCSPSCSPSCRQALNWSRCRTAARSSEVP